MKHLVATGLSTLMMAIAIVPAVKAEESLTAVNLPDSTHLTTQLAPLDLVFLAYRQYLENQGIPGYGALLMDHQTGQITARDIVDAAIQAGRLPDNFTADHAYLNAVDRNLDSLTHRSR